VDIKRTATLMTFGAALLSGAVFFGLAILGNEWRLRNEESAPDDPEWSDE
jgi:hypothetical protein